MNNDMDFVREKIKQLDAERLRIKTEIDRRKHDMKMNGAQVSAEVAAAEKEKITQLEDVLDDVEFDLQTYMEQIFDAAEGKERMTIEKMLDADEDKDRFVELAEKRIRAEEDLAKYKLRYKELETELQKLSELIDATEQEIDDILVELCKLEN